MFQFLRFLPLITLLSVTSSHCLTPKKAFLKAYEADRKACFYHEAIKLLAEIGNELKDLTEKGKSLSIEAANQVFTSRLDAVKGNTLLTSELRGCLNDFKLECAGIQRITQEIVHQQFEKLIPKYLITKLFPQNKIVRKLYLEAAMLNLKNQNNCYEPSETFFNAIVAFIAPDGSIREPNQKKDLILAHLAACFAETGYLDVPKDRRMALLWYYRAAQCNDLEAATQLMLRLSAGVGVTPSPKSAMVLFERLLPYASRAPKVMPYAGDQLNLWVFRSLIFSLTYGILIQYLNLVPPHDSEFAPLISLTGYVLYGLISAGFTSFMENFYCHPREHTPESIKKLWANTSHGPLKTINSQELFAFMKKNLIALTPEISAALLEVSAPRRQSPAISATIKEIQSSSRNQD